MSGTAEDEKDKTPAGGTPAPGGQQPPAPQPGAGDGDGAGETPDFATWLAAQPEMVRTLLEGHTKGLRTALESERGARKDLEKKLAKLAKGEDDPAKKEELQKLSAQLRDYQRQTAFYEQASMPENGVTDIALAYMAAQHDGLIDDDGEVDWAKLKASHPTLFAAGARRPAPPGNAGSGTQAPPPKPKNMNDIIRQAAGRQS